MSIELPSTYRYTTISEGIRYACGWDPSKIAYKHREKTRTYDELKKRIDLISLKISTFYKENKDLELLRGSIPHKSNIAIIASNSIEYMEIVLAASQLGHPIVTVNPKLTTKEIYSICEDADAKLMIVDEKTERMIQDTFSNSGLSLPDSIQVLDFGELEIGISTHEHELLHTSKKAEDYFTLPNIHESDTFTVPYTSGTTGKPKGVMVPHRSRALTLYGMAEEYGCFSSDDRFLSIAPMCHGAGMIFSLAPIFFGGYAEIMDDFDPELVMKTLEEEEITGFFGVPTHFFGMLGVDKSILENCTGSSLKTIISNASALPQSLKEKIVEHFGEGLLYECYGSTEGGIISNLRPDDQLRKKQCVGEPFPFTKIKILNDDGDECEANEVGEIFTASPYVFNGYWRKEKETQDAFDGEWLTVGDLAKKDEDGYLYIVDRKKDMIISGGINIYPREIEEVLFKHPNISDAAVIGIPDEKWGESIKAYIVTTSSHDGDAEEIRSFCEQEISKIKVPKIIEFTNEIPRNATGKVLKTELRKNHGGQ